MLVTVNPMLIFWLAVDIASVKTFASSVIANLHVLRRLVRKLRCRAINSQYAPQTFEPKNIQRNKLCSHTTSTCYTGPQSKETWVLRCGLFVGPRRCGLLSSPKDHARTVHLVAKNMFWTCNKMKATVCKLSISISKTPERMLSELSNSSWSCFPGLAALSISVLNPCQTLDVSSIKSPWCFVKRFFTDTHDKSSSKSRPSLLLGAPILRLSVTIACVSSTKARHRQINTRCIIAAVQL